VTRLTTALVICLSVAALGSKTHAKEILVIPDQQTQEYSKYTKFVLAGLLEQMGLRFPDDQKKEVPVPEPAPAPTKESEDDFFDDDYFSKDLSFDEIAGAMDAEFQDTTEAWDKEYRETVERWEKARKNYLQKEKQYKDKLSPLKTMEAPASVSAQSLGSASAMPKKPDFSRMKPGDFYVINGALDIPIRNQHFRSTCAAFAAVRGVETVLYQHDIVSNFSEQYYYWLAKPDCVFQPCSTRENSGSSIFVGLAMSLHPSSPEKRSVIQELAKVFKVPDFDKLVGVGDQSGIIEESACSYVPNDLPAGNNETMTPLNRCDLKSSGVSPKKISMPERSQLVDTIMSNQPVIAGFRLSSNFHRDKGVITYTDRDKYSDSSKHDGGHAVLLVGLIKLPPDLNEGQYCLITANSWGEGWGRGGYGCLTEKWIEKFDREKGYFALGSVVLSSGYIERNKLTVK